jgi:hypothetical protein
MAEGRSGDLVLSQGTFVLLQDGATGQVEVVTVFRKYMKIIRP